MAYRANGLRGSVPHTALLVGLNTLGLGALSGEALAACAGSISIEANSVSGGAGAMVHSGAFTDVDVNIGAITAQGQDFSLYGQAASGGPGANVRLGGVTIENGRGVAIQQPNGDQVSLSVDTLTVTGSGYGVFYCGSASAANTIEAKTIAGGDGSFGVYA